MTPNSPQILLHVGHEKCGSKTIQQFLRRNQAALLAEGFFCPETSKVVDYDMGLDAYGGNPGALAEYAAVNKLGTADLADFDTYFETALTEEIAQAARPKVVFSFEGLLSRPRAQIHKIGALLQRISSDIRVFAIVRKQDNWAISAYTTRLVHTGSVSRNVLRNDNDIYNGLFYHAHLKFWESAVGDRPAQAVAFEDFADVVEPFKAALGTQIAHDNLPRSNSSLSAYGQEVLRRLNEAEADNPIWHKNHFSIRQALFTMLPHGAPKLPTNLEVDAFMQVFAEDNLRLKWDYLSSGSKYFERRQNYPLREEETDIRPAELEDWVNKALDILGQNDG